MVRVTTGYGRSVPAADHHDRAESVWEFRMPQVRFGRGSVEELGHRFHELGVNDGATGVLLVATRTGSAGNSRRQATTWRSTTASSANHPSGR